MKKVLLASTALVAFSGAAAMAEVIGSGPGTIDITGSAEMGIVGGTSTTEGRLDFDSDGTIDDDDEFDVTDPAQFFNDVNVDFNMTGATETGLAFGVSIDLDDAVDLGGELDDSDFAIFITGDFGTVTLGDTDGAISRIMDNWVDVGSPGSINDSETAHLGYLGSWLDGSGDGQIVRYDFVFDAFQFALSVEQHDDTVGGGRITDDDDNLTWGVGFGYEFGFTGGTVDLGLGYQFSDNGAVEFEVGDAALFGADDFFLGGDAQAFADGENEAAATAIGAALALDNGFTAGFTFTQFDFEEGNDVQHIGIGLGYEFDPFSVHLNYGQFESTDDDIDGTFQGFGLAAGYDLGGGASVLFGYGNSQASDLDGFVTIDGDFDGDGAEDDQLLVDDFDTDIYSLGLSFSF